MHKHLKYFQRSLLLGHKLVVMDINTHSWLQWFRILILITSESIFFFITHKQVSTFSISLHIWETDCTRRLSARTGEIQSSVFVYQRISMFAGAHAHTHTHFSVRSVDIKQPSIITAFFSHGGSMEPSVPSPSRSPLNCTRFDPPVTPPSTRPPG